MFVKNGLIYLTPEETSKLKAVGMKSYQSFPEGIDTDITSESFMPSDVGEMRLRVKGVPYFAFECVDGHYGDEASIILPANSYYGEIESSTEWPNIKTEEQATAFINLMIATQTASNSKLFN